MELETSLNFCRTNKGTNHEISDDQIKPNNCKEIK